MKDYIKINQNVKMNKFISDEFTELLQHEIDDKVHLDYLREIYRNDKVKFIRLYQELVFRGCVFVVKEPNNILQNIEMSNNVKYIWIKENNYIYKNIDFNKYNLGNLVGNYKISDDRFFNFVPIEGFKVFNKEINIKNLTEEFCTNGFFIGSIGEIEGLKQNNVDIITNLKHNEKEEEDISQEEDYFKTIEGCFTGNIFSSFREFSKEIGIHKIDDITKEVIDRYSNYPYVGAKKIEKVKEKLFEINEEEFKLKFTENINESIEDANEIPINELFSGTKYKLFIEFCNKENMNVIGQLSAEFIDKFSECKGVGKKRVISIKETLNKYISLDEEDLNYPIDKPIIVNEKWVNILSDIELYKIAEILNLSWSLNKELTIKNVHENTLEEILSSKENHKELIAVIKKINKQKTIREIINESKKTIKENMINAIELRYKDLYTLEQIGEKLNVSRERARQILVKSNKKLVDFADNFNIYSALKFNFCDKNFCHLEDFYKLCGEDNFIYAKQIVNGVDSIKPCEYLDIIYFGDSKELNDSVEEFISSLPECFKFYDQLDEIIDKLYDIGIDDISIEKISEMIELRGYKHYGEYYSKTKITLTEIFERIFVEYLNEPLCLDEKGYEDLGKICLEKFDYVLDSGIRAAEARIRDIETIILTDRRTLLHIDKASIEDDAITKIEELLQDELKEKDIVSSQYLIAKYASHLKLLGIDNKHILYSIIKYYLSENYITGKGNTMEISKSLEKLKQSREEIIVKLINENHGRITKNQIISSTKWTQFKLEDTIAKSKILIKIGKYLTIEKYINLTDEVKDTIYNVVSREIEFNDFLSTRKLYDDLVIIPHIYDFFQRNDIREGEHLTSIFKYIVPNIKGNSFFMAKKNSKYKNFSEVILSKFPNGFTNEEIINTLEDYHFRSKTVSSFINELVKTGGYIKISMDEYVHSSKFNISEEIINKLIEFIEEKFGDKEYISLNKVTGFKRKLPEIDYEWNIYLIKSILIMNGYRKVQRIFYDISTERLILARENSSIKKFDDLVYYILKNEYQGIMHEAKIYDYLGDIGVIYNNIKRTDKKIPKDLYDSKKFNIDEYGRVELKEINE